MRFTKIAHGEKETGLEWEEMVGEHDDIIRSSLKSEDTAEEAFANAMDALVPPVLKLLQLPARYAEDMHVTSISVQHGSEIREPDSKRGLVVTARKKIEATNAPFMIHTPHLKEGQADGNDVVAEIFGLLEAIEDQAKRFIDGARAQIDMFDQSKSEEPEAVTA